jgi:hypothetical protein
MCLQVPRVLDLKSGQVQAFNHLDKADTFDVDEKVADASESDYDALVLPGGVVNPDVLRMDSKAMAFVASNLRIVLISTHVPLADAIRLSERFIHPVAFDKGGPNMAASQFFTFCVSWAAMLVLVQTNDLGSALLNFGIFLAMLYVATGRALFVAAGLALFLGGAAVFSESPLEYGG